MHTIVSKFGGSSLANADQFKRVFGIIRASPERRCVVLSAPGVDDAHPTKVTSMLEACWNNRDEPDKLQRLVDQVVARYREISEALFLPAMDEIVLREIFSGVGISLEHTLSRGEYLCAELFSRYSGIPMADAAQVVCFDDSGSADLDETRRRFSDLRMERFILPGFYGIDRSGRLRTFPRNGSDITGALAAASMSAALYENWTDVPGLMTADPAIVPHARRIPLVSYRQMRLLARAGTRVLHPACLDPVAMAGIPTRLRNTTDPTSFGTLIDDRCNRFVPALAIKREYIFPNPSQNDLACITAFGLPERLVREAASAYQAIVIGGDRHAVKVWVDAASGKECLMEMHRKLIE